MEKLYPNGLFFITGRNSFFKKERTKVYQQLKELANWLCCFFALLLIYSPSFGQSVDLDQVRNGGANSPGVTWVNGNVNATQGHMLEGYSLAYRVLVDGLTPGDNVVLRVGYDIKESNSHALDYLTSFQRLEPHMPPFNHTVAPNEIIDPTTGIPGLGAPSTFAIPVPPNSILINGDPQPTTSFNNLPAGEREMTIYNGTITNISYFDAGDLNAASSEAQVDIEFSASASEVLIVYGGHIASQSDWGFGNSASSINGSPYHMRTKTLFVNGDEINIGNMDRSLNAGAVGPPCDLDVDTEGSDPTCNGETDGVITFSNPTGGSGNYEYSIDGGTNWQTGVSFTGLAPGNYDLMIRDEDNTDCAIELNDVVLIDPAGLTAESSFSNPT
ncbi:SprB repeat-containing protein, partial [Xanthovirga aplysinae]|uniref:SprB repeat-containing protein n=1 Tax=Xanthovirga aplysinae TaxID=2529853 RepID=UPI001656C06D